MKEKAGATSLHVKSARQKKGSGSRRVTWASRRRPSPPLRKLGQPAELKEVEDRLSGARLSLCVPPHRRRGAHALRCVHSATASTPVKEADSTPTPHGCWAPPTCLFHKKAPPLENYLENYSLAGRSAAAGSRGGTQRLVIPTDGSCRQPP